jgi:hypothetical protein
MMHSPDEYEEDYEDEEEYEEDYEDEEPHNPHLNPAPNTATLMMAGIGREVSTTRYGSAAKEKVWILSSNIDAIFEADDKGDAVFATNYVALLEGLEEKFPAPPGFSFFANVGNKITQQEYPIAKRETPWEEIINIVKDCDDYNYLLVPASNGLPPGTYASYPTGADTELAAQVSARYAVDDEVYIAEEYRHRGYRCIYHDPKIAKKLQGYKKQSEKRQSQQAIAAGLAPETARRNPRQVAPYSRCNFKMWELRELHKAFSKAALGSFEDCHIETRVQINAYGITNEDGSPVKESQRTKHRRIQLVRHITELRKLCMRFKRKWRFDPDENGMDRSVGSAGNLLNTFYPYIKALLKSKNEDYVVFGKWLRTEKSIAAKRARIRAAEAAAAAAKAKEEEEDEPLLGVRRKPRTSAEKPPSPNRVVAATPKMPEQLAPAQRRNPRHELLLVNHADREEMLWDYGAALTNEGSLVIGVNTGDCWAWTEYPRDEWEDDYDKGKFDDEIKHAKAQAQARRPKLRKKTKKKKKKTKKKVGKSLNQKWLENAPPMQW